jgi:hypothetical protein
MSRGSTHARIAAAHIAVAAACGVAPEVIKALLIKPASRSAYGIRGRRSTGRLMARNRARQSASPRQRHDRVAFVAQIE